MPTTSCSCDLGAAATTAGRFAMNSTIGVGGLFDVASKEKLQPQTGDFGQTLYVWGMRRSDYLVVPVIGPTNVRDLIGTTVDFVATIPAGGLAAVRAGGFAVRRSGRQHGQHAYRCWLESQRR